MTPEQEIKLNELYEFMMQMKNVSSLPLDVDRALQARGFVKSNLPQMDTIKPTRGTTTLFVATITGGTLDHPITFKDGILITP